MQKVSPVVKAVRKLLQECKQELEKLQPNEILVTKRLYKARGAIETLCALDLVKREEKQKLYNEWAALHGKYLSLGEKVME